MTNHELQAHLALLRKTVERYPRNSPPPGCSEPGQRNKAEQDSYFVFLIRDVLSQIRHGHTDYVFSLEQVEELLRYEPRVKVTLEDSSGCYFSVSI